MVFILLFDKPLLGLFRVGVNSLSWRKDHPNALLLGLLILKSGKAWLFRKKITLVNVDVIFILAELGGKAINNELVDEEECEAGADEDEGLCTQE